MAQTVYTSKVAITVQNRDLAYDGVATLCQHLKAMANINLVSITRDASNFLVVTLSNALPPEQVDHLGLVGP